MFESITKKFMDKSIELYNDERASSGSLATYAIAVTVFLVVLGYVFAPVGLVSMTAVNTTAAGVATGTNASIWSAIIPITLAALIIAVISNFGKK